MEALYTRLLHIEELLEQILGITNNQTSVLLNEEESDIDETGDALNILEEMVQYKGGLITEVEELEQEFQQDYARVRQQVKEDYKWKEVKELVTKVLEKKEAIVVAEQLNLSFMQSSQKRRQKRMTIAKQPKDVVKAYQKQQRKC